MPLDGSPWQRLSYRGKNPIELYPSPDPQNIYYADGSCKEDGDCYRIAVWASSLAGGLDKKLRDAMNPRFSPDGGWFVYEDKRGERKVNMTLSNIDRSRDLAVPLLGTAEKEYVLMDYTWAPESDRFAVLILERSEYSGQWLAIRNFIINVKTLGNQELPQASGQNARTLWSPGGDSLLLTGTDFADGKYTLGVRILDISSKKVYDFSNLFGISDTGYLLTTNIYFLP